jgi:hypothetical protein
MTTLFSSTESTSTAPSTPACQAGSTPASCSAELRTTMSRTATSVPDTRPRSPQMKVPHNGDRDRLQLEAAPGVPGGKGWGGHGIVSFG